jgi:hypothetical protein
MEQQTVCSLMVYYVRHGLACRDDSERTTGKRVSHNAEHGRRMLVAGFRITWDTVYLEQNKFVAC